MARSKSPASNLPVPQSDAEARAAIVELGVVQRRKLRAEADLADKIAKLKDAHGEKIAPMTDRISELQGGLQIFADANRTRLTNGGRTKTIKFTTGELAWRFRPAKVTIRGIDAVISEIQLAGLAERFLRTKVEINKEALRDDKDRALGIPGITIGSDGEDFIVTPDTDAVEEAIA